MNIKKSVTLVMAACVACCLPLIIPPVVAAFAAGGIGLALLGKVSIGLLMLAAAGAILYYRYYKAQS